MSFSARSHDHALVIPVINEGERIRDQLMRIQALCPRVDIVIADGGSTDDSVRPEFLRSVGVRACLVKRDRGKLSAQLRMGYAWCLTEGYQGIVTIDGNGKDDVAAIADFVSRLEEGFDYVQGSRYRPGGHGINTPLERWVAGRLIHAPIVSLAAGRRLTDTTNGFRGYSRRFLFDPRVAPFRAIFDRYALLFYLSARAGQLGYRICEIPVTRRYPRNEKIPTKVSGVKARFAMLGELVAVALGRYHP